MMIQEIELPVADLPFEAGERFSAIVENGVAHIIVQSRPESPEPPAESDGSVFLEKWAGTLNPDSIQTDDHLDDPRMLSYIQKYQLDS